MIELFFELHKDLPREGPGNNESTRKAFSFLTDIPANPRILDIGCGPGMQTIELAKISRGIIIAIDNHQPYLDQLKEKAAQMGVADQIKTRNKSMFSLDFQKEYFDVIWSEGAIYILGFEKGLKEWHIFLKRGGYLVVSEVSWLGPNPPKELMKFWETEYPAIKAIKENIEVIKQIGYKIINHFVLPEAGWWDHYYHPLEKRITALREKYKGNIEIIKELENEQFEIDLYREYSAFYGYVFYIMQK